MGWQDAPIVSPAKSVEKAAWESAPAVTAPVSAPKQSAAPKPKKPAWFSKEHLDATLNTLGREFQNVVDIERNALGGAVDGASTIGATLLWPLDKLSDVVRGNRYEQNVVRRQDVQSAIREAGANPESVPYQANKLVAQIAGTAGVGPALGGSAATMGASPRVVSALNSGGFALGSSKGRIADAALRAGAGAAVGGMSAGLVNPQDAGVGAMIGGVMPGAVQLSGRLGAALTPSAKPEVADLYRKAQQYGIDIPADRMVDSKSLNAAAASLNYLPFSGRMATEDKMLSQLNRAVSNTFGQDSDNVTMALRQAGKNLGSQFDDTLRNTSVQVDSQLLGDLADINKTVSRELGKTEAAIIRNQINDILEKGAGGTIDGQASYNIKKTLDRIGRRNSNEAHYANELRDKLMDAMNRSMAPADAAAFKQLREQYGNMVRLRKFAQNGAEGGISVARLANMQDVKSPQLQDLADISAQFLRGRESPHGAAQRVTLGLLGGGLLGGGALTGTLPVAVGGITGGRALNSVLNSKTMKGAVLNKGLLSQEALDFIARNPALRTLPVVTSASP